jgi:hypothetical protein
LNGIGSAFGSWGASSRQTIGGGLRKNRSVLRDPL